MPEAARVLACTRPFPAQIRGHGIRVLGHPRGLPERKPRTVRLSRAVLTPDSTRFSSTPLMPAAPAASGRSRRPASNRASGLNSASGGACNYTQNVEKCHVEVSCRHI